MTAHGTIGLALTLVVAASVQAQTVIYVDADSLNDGPGNAWEHAFHYLQDALSVAVAGNEVRVATSTYRPDESTANPAGTGNREDTFQLINGVAIFGGYAGYGVIDPDERNIALYETILSGDLDGNDGADFANNYENSYHIFYHPDTLNLDATAVLDGFTITGGNADGQNQHRFGGGMSNRSHSNPTVRNCTFSANSAVSSGGGMFNYDYSSPTIINCTFSANSAHSGGGMFNHDHCSVTVANCTFSENSAYFAGGIANYHQSNATVTNSTFGGNSADGFNGAMYNNSSDVRVSDCTFSGNSASHHGGGIGNYDSSSTLVNCTFWGNSAGGYGGGISNHDSRPTVANCTFNGNSAGLDGGGMFNSHDTLIVTNCTFSGNSAEHYGGGMFNSHDTSPTLVNCVLWGNADVRGSGHKGAQIEGADDGTVIMYSCIQDADPEDGYVYPGVGNIDDNPALVDANGPDSVPGTGDEDLRVFPRSPCIDAGDNAAVPADRCDLDADGDADEPLPVDLRSLPRFHDDPCKPDTGNPDPGQPGFGIVDMGAFEYQDEPADDPDGDGATGCGDNCPLHSNPGQADCDGDGFGDLCRLLLHLSPDCNLNGIPDECDVASGASSDEDGDGVPDGCQAIYFVDDDASLGGDGTTWETAYRYLQDALAAAQKGDEIRVADGAYKPDQDEGGHVEPGGHKETFYLLNGVELTGGYAGLSDPDDPGDRDLDRYSAILSGDLNGDDAAGGDSSENSYHVVTAGGRNASAILDGFTITAGNADGASEDRLGGGMYSYGGSPTVANCTFTANSADAGGGGMFSQEGSSPIVTNCIFRENSAGLYGGGMGNYWYSSPRVANCILSCNSAYGYHGQGGGMYNSRYSSPTVSNSVFSGNSVGNDGGGMCNRYSSSPTVTNCTFSGNWITLHEGFGAGMYNYDSSNPTLTNCILWGNVPDGIHNYGETATPDVSYCCIQGGYEGDGNIDLDPLFVDYGYWDDGGTPGDPADDFWVEGDYRLRSSSQCINAGDPDFEPHPRETDLDGHARVLCGVVDVGAYEAGIGDADCNGNVDLKDFSCLQRCFAGSDTGPYASGCEVFDFEYDLDVDLDDFAVFQEVFQGPQ